MSKRVKNSEEAKARFEKVEDTHVEVNLKKTSRKRSKEVEEKHDVAERKRGIYKRSGALLWQMIACAPVAVPDPKAHAGSKYAECN
jgi:hypothetical protein